MPVLKIKKNGSWVKVLGAISDGAVTPKLTTISLLANAWEGTSSPYYQVVECNCATECSKIDLLPNPEQVDWLQSKGIALMALNNNGVVVVSAMGGKPAIDCTISALVTEVSIV